MKQHFQLRQKKKKRAVSCLPVISFIYDFARSLGGKVSENFSQEKNFFFAFTKLEKIIRFPVKRGIDCTTCLLNGSSDQNQQPALLGHGHPLIFQRHWWLVSNNWPKDSRKNDGQSLWRLLFFSLGETLGMRHNSKRQTRDSHGSFTAASPLQPFPGSYFFFFIKQLRTILTLVASNSVCQRWISEILTAYK